MSARLVLPRLRAAVARPVASAQYARTYATRAPRADMGEGEAVIFNKLNERFPGKQLDVQDVSGE